MSVEGDTDHWDFGVGAGFYLDATEEKWKNYQMYSYLLNDLMKDLAFLPLDLQKMSITGHSMVNERVN
jgi:S-formylglutathione hydrolase